MAHPLMPKATAVWLVENTTLTFEQIAEFCGIHHLEVQAIADDEVAIGMQGLDPIAGGELTQEEIDRCSADSDAKLKMAAPRVVVPKAKRKGARYTPVSKRQDRPDGIAWLLKNYPELSDAQVSKLVGTTKPTINSVRERTHWNTPNIKPQNPVGLGLCTSEVLEKLVAVARARAGIVSAPAKPEPVPEVVASPKPAPEDQAREAPGFLSEVFAATPKAEPKPAEEPISAADVFAKKPPAPAAGQDAEQPRPADPVAPPEPAIDAAKTSEQ